eukprot:COSAG02_NODE_14_length_56855_cov_512.793661_11_plen_44_part_00
MEDQKASGVAWLDEPKKYGPPLVAKDRSVVGVGAEKWSAIARD